MLVKFRLPKTLLWVFSLLVIFLSVFTAYRLLTLLAFRPEGERLGDMVAPFFLGLRFDLRWISIILLPIITASLIPKYSPFHSPHNRRLWTWYLAIMTFIVVFFFAADFGCFSYNKTRLDASSLNFVEDSRISAAMLWESYPVVWMLVGLVLAVLALRLMFRRLHGSVVIRTDGKGIPYQRKWFVAAILFFAFLAYGNVGLRPLKRDDAFVFNNSFRSYLSLNPLQNFFTTLRLRRPQYNETRARAYFPVMQQWMDLDHSNFSFHRNVQPYPGAPTSRPNIVLVLCESFSMYKSSMSGNVLNTTPFFKSMTDSGIFFRRCFTPHFSTARGLFATITGIPDVQLSKFSTRNPEAIDQRTIINDFKDYKKFYFLGGDPSFNNFEGLVSNIDHVQMNVEGKFSSKPVNVWGISDKDLFLEANQTFAQQTQPFFAIVQTADNHRPFTIPAADSAAFERKHVPKEILEKNGFESEEEYNAFRYADFCFQRFIESARKEKYFSNTIFVFVGDHGVSGDARNIYPAIWTDDRLTDEHVPLLIYAPHLLKPQQHNEVVSQIDVLPTIAGLTDQSYTNTTLGRDVLHNKGKHYAFIIWHDGGRIGMVTDDFYFTRNINFPHEQLDFLGDSTRYSPAQKDSIKKQLAQATTGFYETANWMLLHNKK